MKGEQELKNSQLQELRNSQLQEQDQSQELRNSQLQEQDMKEQQQWQQSKTNWQYQAQGKLMEDEYDQESFKLLFIPTYGVQMPKLTANTGEFKDYKGNNLSNKKRKKLIKGQENILPMKEKNQKELNEILLSCENDQKITAHMVDPEIWEKLPETVAEDVKAFMNSEETPEQCEVLVNKFAGTKEERIDAVFMCIDNFLQIELRNLDLRTDTSFVKNAERLYKISSMTDGLVGMLHKFSDDLTGINDKRLDKVNDRLELLKPLSESYHLRTSIITNPFYKTHLRSEISGEYHREDSEQERNLSKKLQQLDRLMDESRLVLNRDESVQLHNQRIKHKPTERKKEKASKESIQSSIKNYMVLENGKNNTTFENEASKALFTPYIEAFQKVSQLNNQVEKMQQQQKSETDENQRLELTNEINEINQEINIIKETQEYKLYIRLVGTAYKVHNSGKSSSESFCRHIQCLPRLTAAQYMSEDQMKKMIENLAADAPENATQEESGKAAFLNREGLRQYKDLLGRQAEYLFNKYGTGLEDVLPEEMSRHDKELECDFANMQGITETLKYMKNFPGVFDKKSKQDQRIINIMDYYSATMLWGNSARNFLAIGEVPNEAAHYNLSFNRNQQELCNARKVTVGMRKTIDWNTQYKDDYKTDEELFEEGQLREKILVMYDASYTEEFIANRLEIKNKDMLVSENYYNIAQPFVSDMGEKLMRSGGWEFFNSCKDQISDEEMTIMMNRLAPLSPELGDELLQYIKSGDKEGYRQWREVHEMELNDAEQQQQIGLNDTKDMVREHYTYLADKYGKGLFSLPLNEFIKHFSEIKRDFVGEQQFCNLYNKLAGFYDEKNEEDRKLKDIVNYYSSTISICLARLLSVGAGEIKSSQFNDMRDDFDEFRPDMYKCDGVLRDTIEWATPHERKFKVTPLKDKN